MEEYTLYLSNWEKHPENIMINDLLPVNNEFYNTFNILTSHYLELDIKFKYYKKYPLDIYINNKEQLKLLQAQILKKDIIKKDEYDNLSSNDKLLYVINEQQTYQDGYDSYHTEIKSYIKKNIKELRDNKIKEQLKLLQAQILEKDIIIKDEYNKLSIDDKLLYVINEQQTYQDGYDSYHTEIISYIKKNIKELRDNKIKKEIERKEIEEVKIILSKITIYHHEYIKLNSEQKNIYSGIKSTQTESTIYREGPNYYGLYGKKIISKNEYNLLSLDLQKYYIENHTNILLWSILQNYKLL